MREIRFQQQPCDKTCTSACLAMLTGIPVNEVVSIFHEKYMSGFAAKEVCNFFDDNNEPYSVLNYKQNSIVFGNVYLATVPSVNKIATNHHIVIDARDVIEVHDPNMGRDEKKYYVSHCKESKSELEVLLNSYRLDLQMTGFWRYKQW